MSRSSSYQRHGSRRGDDAKRGWLTWGKRVVTWLFLIAVDGGVCRQGGLGRRAACAEEL